MSSPDAILVITGALGAILAALAVTVAAAGVMAFVVDLVRSGRR